MYHSFTHTQKKLQVLHFPFTIVNVEDKLFLPINSLIFMVFPYFLFFSLIRKSSIAIVFNFLNWVFIGKTILTYFLSP